MQFDSQLEDILKKPVKEVNDKLKTYLKEKKFHVSADLQINYDSYTDSANTKWLITIQPYNLYYRELVEAYIPWHPYNLDFKTLCDALIKMIRERRKIYVLNVAAGDLILKLVERVDFEKEE